MRISDILATKGNGVVTIPMEATVRDALAELARHGIGALVVSPDGARIDGIVSERDVVRQLDRRGTGLLDATVGSIMSSPVHTCSPDDASDEVMATMTNQRVRHVPVVADGELRGLVSIGDVVKSRIDDLEANHRILVEYISAR
ncbi:MAG: CBS domain-containing protein [Acidimicrobiales bacterium]